MEVPKIPELEKLLKGYLGPEKTITDIETTRLTAAGENYGSQMLALKIHVTSNHKTEILEAVAKIPPPGEFLKKMFNTPVTFRNEVEFYQVIIPQLEAFLRERNIVGYLDCFPAVLGARLSLHGDKNEVDDDAALVLENLKVQGYEMLDRTIGFDHATSTIVIKALAKYHSVPLAMKILKPDFFQNKIRPLFPPYRVFDMDEATLQQIYEKYRTTTEEIPSCKEYAQRVVDAFKIADHMVKSSPTMIREPWATIIHTDTWVNNFMIRYQDRVPVSCKIVDFQLGEFGSPARDLIFFLFSSIPIPVLEEHYDDLVASYHEAFVDNLVKLGCDPSPFSIEEFHKEIGLVAREYEFVHCMFMLPPIYATKDVIKELGEYSEEDMTKDLPVPPKQREKTEFIIREFVKRGWI